MRAAAFDLRGDFTLAPPVEDQIMKKVSALLAISGSMLCATGPATAALFLKLPGIVGEVTAVGHAGEIEITSMQLGVTAPTRHSIVSQKCSDIVVTKVADRTTPLLLQKTLFGIDFPQAVITVAIAGSGVNVDIVDYYTITLNGVALTAMSQSSGGERPSESLSFRVTSWTASWTPTGGGTPVLATVHCL
jgi:type VI secretion system secreted protein Hcp